jgi:hypothetical protein
LQPSAEDTASGEKKIVTCSCIKFKKKVICTNANPIKYNYLISASEIFT